MDLAALHAQRDERGRARRRRSARIGFLTAVALVMMTLGVFSVGQASQRVTSRSNAVHAYDELLRTTTLARAQLGFSVVLQELAAEAEVDAEAALNTNATDIKAAVAAVASTRRIIDSQLGGLDPDTEIVLDEFVAATAAVSDELSSASVGVATTDRFELAFSVARDALQNDRDLALREVSAADDALGRLGTLISFVVAFVIPSVALFIYRELTRPQRELREFEAIAVRGQVRAAARRQLIDRALGRIGQHAEDPYVVREIEELTATLDAIDGTHEVRFADVDLSRALDELKQTVDATESMPGSLTLTGDTAVTVMTDIDVLNAALTWIAHEAAEHGATTLSCGVTHNAQRVELSLRHDGFARSVALTQRALDPASLTDRLAIDSGRLDVALSVVKELVISVGGSVTADDADDNVTGLIVALPRSRSTAVAAAVAAEREVAQLSR